MREELLEILVCPVCKSKLRYVQEKEVLICKIDKLAYQIEDDIPIMLESQATKLSMEELEQYDWY